jgi:hypothetical protein
MIRSGFIDFNNWFSLEGRRSWRHEAPRAGAQVRARQAQAQARVQVLVNPLKSKIGRYLSQATA